MHTCEWNYTNYWSRSRSNRRKKVAESKKKIDKRNKRVVFKNFAPFRDYLSKINNTQIEHANDLDVVISVYNLIEYS